MHTRLTVDVLACGAALAAMVTGCGAGAAASSRLPRDDGGLMEAPVETGDAQQMPLAGRHSFVVGASILADTAKPPAQSVGTLPPTDAFTLTLDADVPRFIIGGGGASQVVPATTSDGITFRTATSFSISRPTNCSQGVTVLGYESLEVTVSGTMLRGTGAGTATFVSGDVASSLSFLAELTGGPDVTPPFLIAMTGMATSPFDDIQVATSEPLPVTATARLMANDGSHVDLLPQLTSGDFPVIKGFAKPAVVLRTGSGYAISVDGLVDFAGNSGATGAPLRIGSFAMPPLVPADGFESATGPFVGGAQVIRDGLSLSPIAGAASVYIVATSSLVPPGTTPSPAFFARMARQPNATKLRFSYREVGPSLPLSFNGSVDVGSADGPFANTRTFAQPITGTRVMVVPGTFAWVSDVQIMEVPLADSSVADLLVSIEGIAFSCGFGPPGTGLLIDDLLVE